MFKSPSIFNLLHKLIHRIRVVNIIWFKFSLYMSAGIFLFSTGCLKEEETSAYPTSISYERDDSEQKPTLNVQLEKPNSMFVPNPPTRNLLDLSRSLPKKPIAVCEGSEINSNRSSLREEAEIFHLIDLDSMKCRYISADLQFVSPNAYWYFEDGVSYSSEDLNRVTAYFEEAIYPTLANVFGPMWPEGYMGDRRITILHAKFGWGLGYYTSKDEYPKYVHSHSNERKMIYINGRYLNFGTEDYLSVLTHELQHAMHWEINNRASQWLKEGMAQLAAHLMGYDQESIYAFVGAPPTSLVYWPLTLDNTQANYGAAFLFSQFLKDQSNDQSELSLLIDSNGDGITSIDNYLHQSNYDGNFQSIFERWLVANFLGREGKGQYAYKNHSIFVPPTNRFDKSGIYQLMQPQYSARYVDIRSDAEQIDIEFLGNTDIRIIDEDPPTGGHCWWSNRGDEISTTLTKEFDLSELEKASLVIKLWYEIELDWDYAYVQVSADGGLTWDILNGELSTKGNPHGNAYGPGYSGLSTGWKDDIFDLSSYSGQKILLRFHYVTDDAANGSGLCLDLISIPELGFTDDGSINKGWHSDGFYLTNNRVSQGYSINVVESKDGQRLVKTLELDHDNRTKITVSNVQELDELILIIGSLSRYSSQPSIYTVTVRES
ncbi:hypothetical protein FIM04_00095 [SAR202 cluster bacterium AC-409-J13_OGT_754m]|nr:hypothetical protein [SAR202 cluster bacterium AC-409-J13_OGT_754m]